MTKTRKHNQQEAEIDLKTHTCFGSWFCSQNQANVIMLTDFPLLIFISMSW